MVRNSEMTESLWVLVLPVNGHSRQTSGAKLAIYLLLTLQALMMMVLIAHVIFPIY